VEIDPVTVGTRTRCNAWVLTPDGAAVDEVKTKERREAPAARRPSGGGR